MRGDFQEDMRHPDLPHCKEAVMCALFGETVGWLKAQGLTPGQEFDTADKPILQCSRKVIWIDGVTPKKQIVWSFNSIRMEVEFGVCDKTTEPRTVTYREKIENLRYKISQGTEIALTDGARQRFDAMFQRFTGHFAMLAQTG